ncbi:hypothetical protein U1Q18_015965 [Sarracenia purpurea var. burkii]
MTAEPEVRTELCEVSKVAIVEDSGLDMSSSEDPPKVAAYNNGVIMYVDDDNEEVQAEDTDLNANEKDDPDASYVFVSRSNSANVVLIGRDANDECIDKSCIVPLSKVGSLNKDVEGQVRELNDENGEIVPQDYNCTAEGTDVTPDSLLVKPDVVGDDVLVQAQNATAILEPGCQSLNGNAKIEDQIEDDSASDLEEKLKFPTMVSEVGHPGTPQFDDGKIDSEEQTKLTPSAVVGKVQESEFLVLEASGHHDGEEKPEKKNNITHTSSREIEEALPGLPECKSLVLDGGKLNSEEHANAELPTELKGNQESQVMVSEVVKCKLPESVVVEEQTKLEFPQEMKESFDSPITMPESTESESYQLDDVEKKLKEEQINDLRLNIKENLECQLVVTDDLSTGIDEGSKVAKLAHETIVPVETEFADDLVLDENKDSYPISYVEDSNTLAKILKEHIDGIHNTTELSGSSENSESLPAPAYCKISEFDIGSEPVESTLYSAAKDAKLEIEDKNDTVGGDIITSCNKVSSGTDFELPSFGPEGEASTLSFPCVNIDSEDSNRVTDSACIQPIAANSLDLEYHANDSVQNRSGVDINSQSLVESCPPISGRDVTCNDSDVCRLEVSSAFDSGSAPNCGLETMNVQDGGALVNGGDGDDDDNHKCQKIDSGRVQRSEFSPPLLEGSSAYALNGQSEGVEEAVKRPFHFLVKIPRYDDEKLRDQIRHAQLQVDEKTHRRDAVGVDILQIKANCQQFDRNQEAAKSEGSAATRLVKLKRQEIDSAESVLNRVKNAISVKDIDVSISNKKLMLEHETVPLTQEKQLIREINQLKRHREQLSLNMGSQDEVQQASDIEKRLKILKKELDGLKEKVLKAKATTEAAKKKFNDERKKLREFSAKFRAADDIRQKAFSHLQNLKRQLYEKNTQFRKYKDDSIAANDYASHGDKAALHHLCVNQVETFMESWNKDDEYRKEYIRCNTRNTLRRSRTLDSRALGPDDEQNALPNVVGEQIDRSISTVGKANSDLPILTLEQKKLVSTVAGEETYGKPEQKDDTAETRKPTSRTSLATVSGVDEPEEMSDEECKPTKEEQELARKEEELKKEEAAAKLKEQRRLEEKAKAKEALERTRRNAEKAQVRAELRAQKEAEQKEREREKRAKKNKKKRAAVAEATDGNNEGDTASSSESAVVTTKEPEIEESLSTITKKPQKQFQFRKQSKAKSIPPPLRNRGKRKRIQQWIWIIVTAVLVLAVFLLGNHGFYSNLGQNLRMRGYGF